MIWLGIAALAFIAWGIYDTEFGGWERAGRRQQLRWIAKRTQDIDKETK